MTNLEIFFLAVGLSMDAFAVAISLGLANANSSANSKIKMPIVVGLYFGVFQAIMPLAGFFAAMHFADYVAAYSRWIAFALLLLLGVRMIYGGLKKEEVAANLAMRAMLVLAIATSIDAMAAGVTLAFLDVAILPAVLLIGVVTFVVSAAGVHVGVLFGEKFKSGAAFAGGIILILIGLRILIWG